MLLMRLCRVGCALFTALLVLTTVAPDVVASEPAPIHHANYDLAVRWTGQRVGKLVFDMAVTPHWLETGDRFWYAFETNQGRQFSLVDPHARTKKPLFDNARMAAMLTRITLFPYDAQHLPIRTLKFIEKGKKKDAAIQFEIDYPKDADVRAGEQVKSVKDLGEDAKQIEKQNDDMKDKTKEKQTDKQTETKGLKQTETQGQKLTQQTNKQTDATVEAAATTKTLFFEYDLTTEKLTLLESFKAPPKKMLWASLSPDEKTIVFARGHNLFMMDAANYALAQKKADDRAIKEAQLTTDGEEHYGYARTMKEDAKKQYQTQEKDRKDYRVPAIGVAWSKDSKKFAVERQDERKVADLWVINSLSNPRPTLETYRYGMPGEENQPQSEILVFDIAARSRVKVKADRFKDQSVSIASDRITSQERENEKIVDKWLSDTSDRLYFERSSRDRHKLDVCVADTATGDVKVVIEERLNTYIDTQPLHLINSADRGSNDKNGSKESAKDILFWSERDGWGHWYRYDQNGKLLAQITSGEYTCQDIAGIEEKAHVLYVNACGREPGEDPYFTHLYRINMDGSGLKLLNPGDALHAVGMNDGAKYFVDNCSRVNAAPVSQLRDADGRDLADLETMDVSALIEAGYKFPEPFKVKADDGITDLYGVMYKPFDFDPNKRYPIIAYVYPGPQTESVTKTFSPRSANVALAQCGFIVIEVGNRGGNPQRSKWYHNFGYGNLRDYGLADKKHAIEQLAIKYPYIDMERVGIYGHSGGGFMSTAAMLVYPDFFKVAFSESGNHENNIYNRWWSESHHGVREVTDKDGKTTWEYSIDKNSDIAKNLKGHLMLVTGDIDDNVHPANTLRLANALIRANKRFDFFMLPGQRHAYGDMSDYNFWLRADYFCKYLLGDSHDSVDILELDREAPQTGDKRPTRR
jgi:dipeptidyl-peptidase-4